MTIYLGVDPGATGALAAVLDGALLWVEDMPNPLHGAAIRDLFDEVGTHYTAAVEQQWTRPGEFATKAHKQGQNYGILLGALGYARIPYRIVSPQTWKKEMRVTKDKDVSRERATELWPGRSDLFARKKDDGRAEAALIARWMWEQSKVTVAA